MLGVVLIILEIAGVWILGRSLLLTIIIVIACIVFACPAAWSQAISSSSGGHWFDFLAFGGIGIATLVARYILVGPPTSR